MNGGFFAKGAVVRATLAWLASAVGSRAARRLIDTALGPTATARWWRIDPTREVPYADVVALWTGIDQALAAERPSWMEEAGHHSIISVGQQFYGGILAKRTPEEFLMQSVSLFQLFYRPGDMQVVEAGRGHAVLRLVGFEPATTLFCRRLQGGLTAALAAAGGEEGRVRHVRCALEGDAFCEWELRWTLMAAAGGG